MSSSQSSPLQGPPPSYEQSSIQPALPEKSHGRSSSQSSTSEDSQTVLIDAPSSLETSTHQSSDKITETPQAQLSSSSDEPRKCWICFADETEDDPMSSEWVSPCPCALKAHQACLLDWIADLESPKRRKAKKIQCPQCKSNIEVMQPHSLSISFVRAIQRITGVLMWPAAAIAASGMVFAGFTAHGVATTWVLLGRYHLNRLVFPRGGFMSVRRCTGMALIPILLITSRTSFADHILPWTPLMLYASNKVIQGQVDYTRNLSLCITALPIIRSLYFRAYQKFLLPYEKAWMQEIRPRAAENAEENDAQPDQEGGDEEGGEGGGPLDGGPLDMDFELGVQIEVEAVEEDDFEHHHHHHYHVHDEPQPNNQPAQQEAAGPEPTNIRNNQRNDNNPEGNPNPNQEARPPPPQPQPQPRQRHVIQNFIFAIPDFNRLSIGALVFPFVSYYVGELLRVNLPMTWVKPPGFWDKWNRGILQTRYGRTIVGGCLFVVLKDTLFLYSKYSMAQNHKQRRVLNFDEIKKPWYRKNVDELIAGE